MYCRMQFLEKELLAKVTYDNIKFSLQCRGKKITDATKIELVEELYHDVVIFFITKRAYLYHIMLT